MQNDEIGEHMERGGIDACGTDECGIDEQHLRLDEEKSTPRRPARLRLIIAGIIALGLAAMAAFFLWHEDPGLGRKSSGRIANERTRAVTPAHEAERRSPQPEVCAEAQAQAAGADAKETVAAVRAEASARKSLAQTAGPASAPEVVAPVSTFVPGAVYSGTLGDVTRLQAGTEMARAELSLKEVQTRMRELERRAQGTVPAGSLPSEAERSLRADMDRVLALLEKSERAADYAQVSVLAVRGTAGRLEAEILSPAGRHVVRQGDVVPGVGTVERLTRAQVICAGHALPWR